MHIENRWNEAYRLTFSNPAFAAYSAKMFGITAEQWTEEAALHLYLNICLSAYEGFQEGVIDQATLDSNLRSFMQYYRGDMDLLANTLRDYDARGENIKFAAECIKWLPEAEAEYVGSRIHGLQ